MVRDENNINEAIVALELGVEAALRDVGEKMTTAIDDGFDDGQDALGRPWEPLQPETIAETGPDILIDEGDFRESWDYAVDSSSNRLRVGTDSELAKYHEWGVPENNLPARPVLMPALLLAEQELLTESLDDLVGEKFDGI